MDYDFLTTADGSPSLRLSTNGRSGESMHSLLGAFGETDYIYGYALRRTLHSLEGPVVVLSLGLGLGYVETLTLALARQMNRSKDLRLISYEIEPELKTQLTGWLQVPFDLGSQLGDSNPFARAYSDIFKRTSSLTSLAPSELHETARTALDNGSWTIEGAFDSRAAAELSAQQTLVNCWCFDAFSSKSDPHLWTEEFLTATLTQASAPDSCFSTYACTGQLKRALLRAGFALEIRQGFSGKRDSTFAGRGLSK
jgi:tRNA U34 5-methylaminomethyl-2-thiouridine-forming methyltransferase MnmC